MLITKERLTTTKAPVLYKERATGETLTPAEMLTRFQEDYDGGDPFNDIPPAEYFERLTAYYYDNETGEIITPAEMRKRFNLVYCETE